MSEGWLKNDLSRFAFRQRTTGKWLHKKLMFGGKDLLKRKAGFSSANVSESHSPAFMAVNPENILCLWSEECKRYGAKVKKLKLDSCSLCCRQAWSRHSYSKARCRAEPDECIERSLLKGWLMLPFHFSSHNINNLFAAFDFPPLKANNNFTFSSSYRSFLYVHLTKKKKSEKSSSILGEMLYWHYMQKGLYTRKMADIKDWCSVEPHRSPSDRKSQNWINIFHGLDVRSFLHMKARAWTIEIFI